jgi:hypothetical protein
MDNETLKQLYEFTQKLGNSPQWIDENSFSMRFNLNPHENIPITISQVGERIDYWTPFVDLSEFDAEHKEQVLTRLLRVNSSQDSSVVAAMADDVVYLRVSQPVTYDNKLDRQLFIQNHHALARFYEENHDAFAPTKG